MPKICQPKTYGDVSHYRTPTKPESLPERKPKSSHRRSRHSLKYSSPIKVNCNHFSHDIEQNMIWYDEAVRRASGRSTLQRPVIDRLQCRGRTIYDTQHIALKPKQDKHRRLECLETPATSTSKVRRYRSKTSAPNSSRRRSLIDETLHQTENGKALRNILPVSAFSLIIEHQEENKSWLKPLVRGPDNEIYLEDTTEEKIVEICPETRERRFSIPSLTWSDSPEDDSDGEAFPIQPPVSKPALKLTEPPVVVHSFSGDLDSFPNDYLINPLDPLGYVYTPFPSPGNNSLENQNSFWGNAEFYDNTANHFFEMFVNTDNCEDIFSHAC